MMRGTWERNVRTEICNICLRGLLKLFNFLLAFVGLSLTFFAIWRLYKVFESYYLQDRLHTSSTHFQWNLPDAWFPYFLLGLGLIICLISFIGHIAAETSIGCCLSSYMFFLVILLLLQGAFVAEVLLNENWEEIIPDDPSGLFDSIKEFVEANADFCKWTGIAVVIIEVVGLLLAFCIKAASPRSLSYDSDDEYILPRTRLQQPLLVPRPTTDCSIPAATGTVEGWPVSR